MNGSNSLFYKFNSMYYFFQDEYLNLPSNWRDNTSVFMCNYTHKLCENGKFVLVTVPLGTSVIVNGNNTL